MPRWVDAQVPAMHLLRKPVERRGMSGDDEKRKGGRPTERGEAKRSAIAVRTTPAVKDRLTDAATRAGRSLTQEIEQRLERSLEGEDALGGAETANALRALASEIANVERRTGKSWLEDHATHTAATTLMLLKLDSLMPPMLNWDGIREAREQQRAAQSNLKATLDFLADCGVVREVTPTLNALMQYVPKRRGMFGRSSPSSQFPDLPLPETAAFEGLLGSLSKQESEDAKTLRHALAGQRFELLIDPDAPPSEWGLLAEGHPIPDPEKVGIRAMLFRVPKIVETVRKAQQLVSLAYQPQMEAQAEGGKIADAIKAERTHD